MPAAIRGRKAAELRSGGAQRRLEAKDFAFLEALGAPPSGADQWLHLSLGRCGKCGTTNALDVFVVTGATKFATSISGLLVTAAECDEIQRIGREAAGSRKRP